MLRRIIWLLIAFPAALLLVTLAVVNRHAVRLILDPFRPEAPVLSLVLPFYAYLLGTLLLGVVLGGTAVWLSQGRWRRTARVHGKAAVRWRAEADRLTRERDAQTVGRPKQLAASRSSTDTRSGPRSRLKWRASDPRELAQACRNDRRSQNLRPEDEAALDAALGAGADYVGLVFCAASPRNVDFETAHRLAERARGRAKIVALLVDPDDTLLDGRCGRRAPTSSSSTAARHRSASPRSRSGWPPRHEGGQGRERRRRARRARSTPARPTSSCSMPRPPGRADALPGGNGVAFDWQALAGVRGKLDYMLSGGLTPRQRRRGDPPHRRDRRRRLLRRREPPGEKDPS